MLYEFAPDLVVLAIRGDGQFQSLPLRDLLPHGFGPEALGDVKRPGRHLSAAGLAFSQ